MKATAQPPEARPLYFGPSDMPLFGWLHPAAAATPGGLGLVICNPFGNEAICANRTIRHLAQRTAQQGIPTLRFDYAGTGDSAGNDFEPDRLRAWLASVAAAADELQKSTGVTRLCLLGMRLGVPLAALAAAKRTDIAALIAIAPVVKGKGYVRELRMLQRATDGKRTIARAEDAGTLDSAGFTLTAQTQTVLSEIDLTRLATPPATRVLILDRAELPSGEGWELHLRNGGAQVERLNVEGYTEMMLDSHESIVPEKILAEATRWLAALREEQPATVAGTVEIANARAPNTLLPSPTAIDPIEGQNTAVAVQETAVTFGPTESPLFGIVSAPAPQATPALHPGSAPQPAPAVRPGSAPQPAPAPRTGAPAPRRGIILINSGAIHHVGPNRMYVNLARRLARLGHVVLRMDIAGLGDSPTPAGATENIVYPKHAVENVAAAIQYLRSEWNVQDIRATGLCSGAYHAFKAAAARLPLNGVVLINPLTFFWQEGMSLKYPEYRVAADIMRYRTNILRPAAWIKLLRGKVDLWESSQVLLRRASGLARTPMRNVARSLGASLQNDLPSELRSIVGAGVGLHFLFAAQDPGVEMLRDQGGAIARRLREKGTLQVETIDGADHTFTDRELRTSLATLLQRALAS